MEASFSSPSGQPIAMRTCCEATFSSGHGVRKLRYLGSVPSDVLMKLRWCPASQAGATLALGEQATDSSVANC